MQLGSFRPYSVRHDTLGIVSRINELSSAFRAGGHKVIFVQHDGSREGCFLPGSEDWSLLPELHVYPDDIVVSKTANDAFYRTELQNILSQNGISELYITGCATDFCVDTTVKSALSRDFNVTVVADAHTTADRPFINAPTVIAHYNWLWADMSPTKYKIAVGPTAAVLQRIV